MTRGPDKDQFKPVLEALQADNSRTDRKLMPGVHAMTVNRTMKRLRDSGIVLANKAVLDPSAVGLHTLAFCEFGLKDTTRPRIDQTIAVILSFKTVQAVYHLFGKTDLLVKIRCRSPEDIRALLEALHAEENIRTTETMVVYETSLETTDIDLSGFEVLPGGDALNEAAE